MTAGGYVISDQPLSVAGWISLSLPEDAEEGRIHLYRTPGK